PAIVWRPCSKNSPHDSTITSVSELDQGLFNLRRPVTSFDNEGLETGEVVARRNDFSSTTMTRAPNIISRVSRDDDQDMEIQDLWDSESVQLDFKVGEALIVDVSACCAEDGKAQGLKGSKRSLLAMQDLKYRHKLDMLVILEPRISSSKAWKVISQLGFPKAEISDAVGFSGGIWLLWDDAKFNLRVIHCMDQAVSVCVETAGGFKDWFDQHGLIDLGFLGPKFTWVNKRVGGDFVMKRLDRAICNKEWRKRRNRIERLKDINGDWISSKEGLKALAVEYFHGLFLDDVVDIIRSPLPSLFPHIPEADLAVVSKEVTEKEVQDALFAIGPYKAPGSDGYSAIFFHNCWSLCRKDIEVLVFKCFSSGSVPEYLNNTLVTLVPKITNPQSMLQFRPISLCNTLYKVVSKIIVGRLRPLMCKLVSPNQLALFLDGKFQIIFSLPKRFCIDSIEQELSHIIAARVLKKEWKAVRAARSGPLISHLFFADDLILFGEASVQQAMEFLVQGRVTKATYKGVLVKVQAKLFAWKSQLLSMAGRITLIQSVVSSIPLYTMQTAKLPQALCEDLDKSSKSFLWGSSENHHKTHLVKWDTVCLPKRLGGSCCFDAYDDNCTLASSSWKGLIYGAAILNNGLKWRVGDGTRVKFWTDTWIGDVPLIDTKFPLSDQLDKSETMSNYFSRTGWNINKLLQVLLPEAVMRIVNPPRVKMFTWLLTQKKILTNVQRVRRHLSRDPSCPLCHYHEESLQHLFISCPHVLALWRSFYLPEGLLNFFSSDFDSWLKENLCYNAGHLRNLKWCSYLSNSDVPCLAASSLCFSKLNIDGSRVSASGCIAAGGIIRNSEGSWIAGFSANLGHGEVLVAEAWALYYGLNLAWQMGLRQITLNSDSALVVDMING
ncbi:zinc ion-binding protein, partial [Prunus dulcis]